MQYLEGKPAGTVINFPSTFQLNANNNILTFNYNFFKSFDGEWVKTSSGTKLYASIQIVGEANGQEIVIQLTSTEVLKEMGNLDNLPLFPATMMPTALSYNASKPANTSIPTVQEALINKRLQKIYSYSDLYQASLSDSPNPPSTYNFESTDTTTRWWLIYNADDGTVTVGNGVIGGDASTTSQNSLPLYQPVFHGLNLKLKHMVMNYSYTTLFPTDTHGSFGLSHPVRVNLPALTKGMKLDVSDIYLGTSLGMQCLRLKAPFPDNTACSVFSKTFCDAYPNHPKCLCYTTLADRKKSGGYSIPGIHDVCWIGQCSSTGNVLSPPTTSCPTGNLTICSALIEASKDGKIDLKNVKIQQDCSKPNPPTPTPSGKNTYLIVGLVVLIILLGIASIFLTYEFM